jgi:biopolymer transport protein ExbD
LSPRPPCAFASYALCVRFFPVRFYLRKRRQAPAVIIVALIDVLIVLLIFLMVSTSFNRGPSFKLALPESSQAQKPGASETPTLVVSIDPQGNLRFGPDSKPVTAERLRVELMDAIAKNADIKLEIRGDKESHLGQFVRVMDAAKEAKVKAINVDVKEAKP